MAMTIKVDSSVLQNKAQDITQQIGRIENALKAVAQGVRSVRIKHADDLLREAGTTIENQ